MRGPRIFRNSLLGLGAVLWLAGCAPQDAGTPVASFEGMDPDLVRLLEEMTAVADASPEDGRAWGRLGMAYQANLSHEHSLRNYSKAQALDPQEPRWWYLASIVLSKKGDLPAAVASVDSALARDPEYAPAWWRRGEWMLAQGDVPAAEACYRRAAELRPQHPSGWIGLARIHLQRGEPELAEKLLLDAIERRPRGHFVPYLRQLLGTVYRQTGRLEEAKQQLAQGHVGRPVWHDPWWGELDEFRITLRSRLTKLRRTVDTGGGPTVLDELEALREQNPTHATVLTYLGVSLKQAGRAADARAVLEEAVEHHPTDDQAWRQLGEAAADLGDFAGALRAAERAIELNPRRARAHSQRGTYLARLGRIDDAVAAFEESLAIDPTHGPGLSGSAQLLGSRGEWAGAAARWEALLDKEPENVAACLGAAEAHLNARAPERASELLDQAAMLAPDNPRIELLRSRL